MASVKSEAVQTILIPTTLDKPKGSNLLFRGTLWIILAMGLSFFAAYQLIGREDFNLPRVERTTFHEPGTSLLDSVSSALGWNKRSVKTKRQEPENIDEWREGETTPPWENRETETPNWDKLFEEFYGPDADKNDEERTEDSSIAPSSTTTTTGKWPTESGTPEYTSRTSTTLSSSYPTETSLSSSQTPGSSSSSTTYIGRTSTTTTQSLYPSQNSSTITPPVEGGSSSTSGSTVSPPDVMEDGDECYHNAYPLNRVCQLNEEQVWDIRFFYLDLHRKYHILTKYPYFTMVTNTLHH